LNGGTGHKDAVIAPQVPAGGSIGQAIFDHETHRQLNHPMGVVATGWCHITQVDVEILLAWCTVVRGVRHEKVNRATRGDIAEVVQRTLPSFVARGELVASWAGRVLLVTAVRHTLRCWEVLDVDNTLRRV